MPYRNPQISGNIERARQYRRDWYARNRESQVAKAYQNKRKAIQLNREYINELRRRTPCADCERIYPHYVLDFDHVQQGKVKDVMWMVHQGWSRKRIDAEIAKCEIVCANCHRERSHRRSVAETEGA